MATQVSWVCARFTDALLVISHASVTACNAHWWPEHRAFRGLQIGQVKSEENLIYGRRSVKLIEKESVPLIRKNLLIQW